jgi:hypothetical protein
MCMRILKPFSVLLLILIKTVPAFAWGHEGHVIVAEIAIKYLNQNVQDSVQKYLGTLSFAEAATWMDDIRKDHNYDNMKTWHYLNVEKDKTYVKTTEENVVTQLELAITELKKKSGTSVRDKNFNLKLLFHLIGDLHMPLHVGYGSDRGGNSVSVSILGRQSNLHRVWDTDIIEAKKITTADCLKLISAYSPSELRSIRKIDVIAWMTESRALLPDVYDFKGDVIDPGYINKNAPVVAKQLAKAGLRLAEVLNESFKN